MGSFVSVSPVLLGQGKGREFKAQEIEGLGETNPYTIFRLMGPIRTEVTGDPPFGATNFPNKFKPIYLTEKASLYFFRIVPK